MRPTPRYLPVLLVLLVCALAAPSLGAAGPGATAAAPSSGADIPGFELLGSLALIGPVAAVAVQGNYAYAGVGNSLVVLNVADPAHLAQLGHVQFPDVRGDTSTVYAVAVAGRYVYAGVEHGLRVVDVADPAHPVEVGRYIITDDLPRPLGAVIDRVVVAGGYVYAVTQRSIPSVIVPETSELRVLDIANPRAPTSMGAYYQQGMTPNAVVAGHYAYLAGKNDYYGQSLFKVVDIANPAAPALAGSTTMGSDALDSEHYISRDVGLAGHYAYVGFSGEMWVFDVADSAAPHVASRTVVYGPHEEGIAHIAMGDGYAYVAGGTELRALDLADPVAPAEDGRATLPAPVSDVIVAGGALYVASGQSLFVLRHRPLAITGRITHMDGVTPAPGVTIAAGATISATTDISGTYALYDLSDGTYTLTPTLPGYSFWPITQTVTLAGQRVVQDFVLLPPPVEATLAPNAAATLVSTDTQGLRTELAAPAGAVTQTTTLRLTPTVGAQVAGYVFAGNAFTLVAERAGQILPELSFGQPLTVTIGYSAADTRVVSDTSKLALWRWTGGGWQDAAQSCVPASSYGRDLTGRTLAVAICRTGRFALLGPTRQVYVPAVQR